MGRINQRSLFIGVLAAAGMVAGAMTGCRSSGRAATGSAADYHHVVGFQTTQSPAAMVAMGSAETAIGLEGLASRNDAGLSVRSSGPMLATEQWPTEERPTLFDVRRLRILPSSPDQILIFGTRSYRHWR